MVGSDHPIIDIEISNNLIKDFLEDIFEKIEWCLVSVKPRMTYQDDFHGNCRVRRDGRLGIIFQNGEMRVKTFSNKPISKYFFAIFLVYGIWIGRWCRYLLQFFWRVELGRIRGLVIFLYGWVSRARRSHRALHLRSLIQAPFQHVPRVSTSKIWMRYEYAQILIKKK